MRYLQLSLPCLVLFLVSISSARGADGVAGEKPAADKMVFSHLGIYTAEKMPGMHKVKGAPVWVSDFQKHPFQVEWLWVESDKPAGKLPPPHVAYRVKSIKAAAKDMKVLTKPFCPGIFDIAQVGFYESADGATIEFMEFKDEAGCGCADEQPAVGKPVFSHVGLITTEKKPAELFVEASRVWVTDFRKHPFHIEWLRFEPDTTITGPLRNMPHVAYAVKKIEPAAKGLKVLAEPFSPGVFGIARVAFYQTDDGLVVELMEFKDKAK